MTAIQSDPRTTPGSQAPTDATLPGMLYQQSLQRPTGVALRKKDFGIWQPTTWLGYFEAMRSVGLALNALGIAAGDCVGIVSENEPAWLYADLGAQSIGALSVATYPTQVAEEVIFIMSHSKCRVIFCGDQEQVDKVRDNRDQLPELAKIVVFDMGGVVEYRDPMIESFADFVKSGEAIHAAQSQLFLDLLGSVKGEDLAIVSYTSGTTGRPKGAMLRHRDQLAMATALAEWTGLRPKDRDLCHFPLSHPTVRVMDAYTAVVAGNSVNFPESPGTVTTDIVELAPTFILGTPRVYELMKADVEIRINRAAWIKRHSYGWSRKVLASILDRKLAGKSRVYDVPLRWIANIVIGRWVLERLGLSAVRYAAVVGASVSPELLKFFWSFGVPLYETYGQAETSGVAFGQKELADLGTTGWRMPGVESKLSDDGELLLRGDGIFAGYYDDAAQTEEALLPDGWYRTGDVAFFDDAGRLVVTDRQRYVISNPGGSGLSPSEIENQLRLSPYVSDVMVVGEGRPSLGALVQIEYEAVAEWAQRQNLPFTTFRSLAENPAVLALLDDEVAKANEILPPEKRVAAHRLLLRELDGGEGELTPTRKIKRDVVAARYADLIDEMYSAGAPSASAG